jgi:N-glycosylase/DNA lyase
MTSATDTTYTKDSIRNILKRYAGQMAFLSRSFAKYGNGKRLKSISRIKNYLEYYKKADLKGYCNLVLTLEQDLLTLLPRENTKNNTIWTPKIEGVIQFSKSYLNK